MRSDEQKETAENTIFIIRFFVKKSPLKREHFTKVE